MDFISTDRETKKLYIKLSELPKEEFKKTNLIECLDSLSIIGTHSLDSDCMSWEFNFNIAKETIRLFLVRMHCDLIFDFNKLKW